MRQTYRNKLCRVRVFTTYLFNGKFQETLAAQKDKGETRRDMKDRKGQKHFVRDDGVQGLEQGKQERRAEYKFSVPRRAR